MTPSPVGMRCPECVGETQEVRRPKFSAGGSTSLIEQAPATAVLIGLNVGVFLLQMLLGGGANGLDGEGALLRDAALCTNAVGSGGLCGPPPIDSAGGEWYRILSSGFLHGDLIHLALNMFVLFILGRMLEPGIGSARFVAIYAVSLVGGSLGAVLLTDPFVNTVGASGAIYGLFGATLLIARDRGLDQIVSQLGLWLVILLVFTFTREGISIGGHLGGLAAGGLAAWIVLQMERRPTEIPVRLEVAGLAAVAVAVFVATIVVAGSSSGTPF